MVQLHNCLESVICSFIQQQDDNEENAKEKNTLVYGEQEDNEEKKNALVSGEGLNQLD